MMAWALTGHIFPPLGPRHDWEQPLPELTADIEDRKDLGFLETMMKAVRATAQATHGSLSYVRFERVSIRQQ